MDVHSPVTAADLQALAAREVDDLAAEHLRRVLAAQPTPVQDRVHRLTGTIRRLAPRALAAVAGTIAAVTVMYGPAQAATATPAPARVSGPAYTSPGGTGSDVDVQDMLEDLTQELSQLLALLGDDLPQAGVDELEKYLRYSMHTGRTEKSELTGVPVKGPRPMPAVAVVGRSLGEMRETLGNMTAHARQDLAGPPAVPADEDVIDAALDAGDLPEFRRLLFASIDQTRDVDDRNLARVVAVHLDNDKTSVRQDWLDMIDRVRTGARPDLPPSADQARQARESFASYRSLPRRDRTTPYAATMSADKWRRGLQDVNVELFDSMVRRAVAAEYARQLGEQIDRLQTLKAERVQPRSVRISARPLDPRMPGLRH